MTVICIDDGPTDLTDGFLDVLQARGRRAVFALVGEKIPGHELTVRRIVEEGHEIANHSMTHQRLTELDDQAVLQELELADRTIARAAGVFPVAFRPPFAAIDDRVLELVDQAGYRVIYTEPSVGDYCYDNADELAQAALNYRSFVGLHELPQTLAALPAILEAHPA